jgi:thioredoxin
MEVTAMSQACIPSVDDETFSAQVLTSDVPVLVEFGAVWCGPCRALGPILTALAQEGAGRWKVVAVDMDASPGIAAKHSVRGVPTVVVFSKGVEVGRHLGLTRRETLLGLLDRARSATKSAISSQPMTCTATLQLTADR